MRIRISLENQSMIATVTRIIPTMKETSSQLLIRIRSASCIPIPPAPTTPRMVAERVFEFEEVKNIAQQDRKDLRKNSETHDVDPFGPGGENSLDLVAVHIFDRLCKELGQHSHIPCGDCHHARKRPEADDIDEDQRPDEHIDPPDEIEKTPDSEMDDAVSNDVLRSQKSQGHSGSECQKGSQKRHAYCFEQGVAEFGQPAPVRGGKEELEQPPEFSDPLPQPDRGKVHTVETKAHPPCK